MKKLRYILKFILVLKVYFVSTTIIAQHAPVACFTGDTYGSNGHCGISLVSKSLCHPMYWTWNLQGGQPSISTVENPIGIQYNAIGLYNITLTVENQYGIDSTTKIGILHVSTNSCFFDTSLCSCIPIECNNSNIDINEDKKKSIIEIYPNPMHDYSIIMIKTNVIGTYTLRLYNLLGEQIKTINYLQNGNNILKNEGIKHGIYVYKFLCNENIVACGKLIIDNE